MLEGLVPVVMSLFLYFILPDNPETARFLKPHEKEFIINRLALETGSGHGRVTNADKIRPVSRVLSPMPVQGKALMRKTIFGH
jgi:hypothetical protein